MVELDAAAGDTAAPVRALKEEDCSPLHVIGRTVLTRTLIEADLVDEFRFMIDLSSWAASVSSAMTVRSSR